VYECVYVCVYVCVCECVYVCVSACVWVRTRVERGKVSAEESKEKCEWLHQFNNQKWLSRRDTIVSWVATTGYVAS
jgi:hypothetical protein